VLRPTMTIRRRTASRYLVAAFAIGAAVLLMSVQVLATEPDLPFGNTKWGISGEATFAHFGPRLNGAAWLQAWNLSARFSLLPFGISRFNLFDGAFDGSLEVGLEPTFERFTNQHQNFAGVGLVLRYYLLHFRFGRLVPWIEAGITPGGSDLNIGGGGNETLLTGPFMSRIEGGIGFSYFINGHFAPYIGLQAQHLSNGDFNGGGRNNGLNTVASFTVGGSWFFE
jgi:Lipid A 3-O-deacylase (PagL)